MTHNKDKFKVVYNNNNNNNINNSSSSNSNQLFGHNIFQLPTTSNELKFKHYFGEFIGYGVKIIDLDQGQDLYRHGCFGKGILSRSTPIYDTIKDKISGSGFHIKKSKIKKTNTNKRNRDNSNNNNSNNNNEDPTNNSNTNIDNNNNSSSSSSNHNLINSNNINKEEEEEEEESRTFKQLKTSHTSDSIVIEKEYDHTTNNNIIETTSITTTSTSSISSTITSSTNNNSNNNNNNNDNNNKINNNDNLDIDINNESNQNIEYVQLSLCEAFYLLYGLGCLTILRPIKSSDSLKDNSIPNNGKKNMVKMDIKEAFKEFQIVESNFIERYIVYHYFRSLGWIPRSGLKYGCDFILYKLKPELIHAQYGIVIQNFNSNNIVNKSRLQTWDDISSINRVSETVAKGIIVCNIFKEEIKSNENQHSSNDNSDNNESITKNSSNQYQELETLSEYYLNMWEIKRWVPTRTRN